MTLRNPPARPAAAHCPHVSACPLFPLFRSGSNLEVWKSLYCHGDHASCHRYKLSSEGRTVPLNLLPNGDSLPAV